MQSFSPLGGLLERVQLACRGWQRINTVSTERFNEVLAACKRDGWRITYEYDGWDAWIDYGRVDLMKDDSKLRFEWTNWREGEILGPGALLRRLAEQYKLPQPDTK
jgi:hypothetical protein